MANSRTQKRAKFDGGWDGSSLPVHICQLELLIKSKFSAFWNVSMSNPWTEETSFGIFFRKTGLNGEKERGKPCSVVARLRAADAGAQVRREARRDTIVSKWCSDMEEFLTDSSIQRTAGEMRRLGGIVRAVTDSKALSETITFAEERNEAADTNLKVGIAVRNSLSSLLSFAEEVLDSFEAQNGHEGVDLAGRATALCSALNDAMDDYRDLQTTLMTMEAFDRQSRALMKKVDSK